MPTQPTQQEEWEKELLEIASYIDGHGNKMVQSWYYIAEPFIRSHKSLWQKEAREEVINRFYEMIPKEYLAKEEIIDKINSLK